MMGITTGNSMSVNARRLLGSGSKAAREAEVARENKGMGSTGKRGDGLDIGDVLRLQNPNVLILNRF